MPQTTLDAISNYLDQHHFPVSGIVDAATLNRTAPEGFRPQDMMPHARSVIIIAKPLPLSVFQTPRNHRLYSFYTSAFHAYYQTTNDATNTLCLMLQDAGHDALPIPSYSPLIFHEGEPHGLISLKHAAVAAGLGKMGKNTLLIHPKKGNILRFGGLMTGLDLPTTAPDSVSADIARLCPEKCHKCIDACPVGALSESGINKTKCMGNCIEHLMMPPQWCLSSLRWVASKSRFFTNLLDLFTLSFFDSYGISCFACLKACPHFPGNRKKSEV